GEMRGAEEKKKGASNASWSSDEDETLKKIGITSSSSPFASAEKEGSVETTYSKTSSKRSNSGSQGSRPLRRSTRSTRSTRSSQLSTSVKVEASDNEEEEGEEEGEEGEEDEEEEEEPLIKNRNKKMKA
ncbi:hypothetical protein BGX27_005153, partial [Mortierella sp. AM989]